MWYILFLVGNPPNPNDREMFSIWFIEDPNRSFFWYHAIPPVICALLALAYFSSIGHRKPGAILLCGLGIALALSAWLMSNEAIAFFVTLPLIYGAQAARHPTTRRSGP